MEEKQAFLKSIISRMSLEEKIGQTQTIGVRGKLFSPFAKTCIEKYHCGGFRLIPKGERFQAPTIVDPDKRRNGEADKERLHWKLKEFDVPAGSMTDYRAVLRRYQQMAMSRPSGVPLHMAFDNEGSTGADWKFGGAFIFPQPMAIRAAGGPRLAYEVANALAREIRAAGGTMIHSPCVDISVNPRNPEVITRAYSDKAEVVAEYAVEAAKGFRDGGLTATAKHFCGRGDSDVDAHFDIAPINVDWDTLWNRELLPYRAMIEAKVLPAIMIAHSIFQAVDPDAVATVSKKVITDLLREKLGFEGVITTDSIIMGGLTKRYGANKAAALALAAGADLVLNREDSHLVHEIFEEIRKAVEDGLITEADLDEKVYRILKMKYDAGQFHFGLEWREDVEDVVRDPQLLALEKNLNERSVYVVRDRHNWLPLPREQRAVVIEQTFEPFMCENDVKWHGGLLWESCCEYSDEISFVEVNHEMTAEDEERVRKAVAMFDTIILTNWFMRGHRTITPFVAELCRDKSKRVIVLSSTPYEALSIPPEADCVVVQFSVTPGNTKAAADIMFGALRQQAQWPVELWPGA